MPLFTLFSCRWVLFWMHCSANKSSMGLILWGISSFLTHGWGYVSFFLAVKVKSYWVPQGDVERNEPWFRFFVSLFFLLWAPCHCCSGGCSPSSHCVQKGTHMRFHCFLFPFGKVGKGEGIWAGVMYVQVPVTHGVFPRAMVWLIRCSVSLACNPCLKASSDVQFLIFIFQWEVLSFYPRMSERSHLAFAQQPFSFA